MTDLLYEALLRLLIANGTWVPITVTMVKEVPRTFPAGEKPYIY